MLIGKKPWAIVIALMLMLVGSFAVAAETTPKQVIATDAGANTLLAADPSARYVIHAVAVLATSTTSVQFYVYNGDHMLLGNATNKLTVDLDGGDGPPGFVLPYNERGWGITDTKNEALQINLAGETPSPVIVIVCFSYIQER